MADAHTGVTVAVVAEVDETDHCKVSALAAVRIVLVIVVPTETDKSEDPVVLVNVIGV